MKRYIAIIPGKSKCAVCECTTDRFLVYRNDNNIEIRIPVCSDHIGNIALETKEAEGIIDFINKKVEGERQ